ncbi:S-layer homology domain-containing protein [Ruminococcaceae bacterium AM07-15]|nr:S-layer homology domain-containing protein [Ruminococcaceae bacterium AM07-15]
MRRKNVRPRNALRRVSALLLTLAMLIGLMPQWSGEAQAASYMQPYLDKMVNWGFMRGDIQGNLRPDNNITRAEFVTIINRAFGYKKIGTTPFKDVKESDWYSDDVAIAYNVGYINGTSKSTFSPTKEITREEAAVILARNLMMQASVGESTSFTDSRELSSWSRGLVDTAASYKLISGYPDGSFRPHNPITRGETAIMVVNAVGTPVSKAEEYQLGSVYGNVLITASGATLKNTTIAGNLYVTAGVDLGNVLLENVTVLGEIVLSGGGVSEGGDDSLVLRNVNGSKIIVDNLKNQQVSLRVEGDGTVDVTSVRTDTYIVDRTASGYGLKEIQLDGEDGRVLKLSGNVKKVVNYTPKSYIGVESGQVETITIDEKATGSTLHIAAGATVDQLNLDVGTTVTGDGDVANLTVNADGSTVSMLPDQIIIRPGVEANIDGEVMDTEAAAESSSDPRMLAGYPQITDLAPTSATAKFAANKKGTIYWAVTSVTDGSVNAQDLINPPSYSSTILKKGSVSVTGSGQTATAKISGLTSDGAYYLSAVLVDAREDQSPVKVISFTTPDNTVPAFATGYPYLSRVTNVSAQVTTMATKTCRLYYAVLPKGSKAPTGEDFKANAVTGNLGYGSLDVSKNTPYTFDVNNVPLEELQSYDLYLWLTDIEGGSSSAVKKLTFTTVDKTPPVFQTEPTVNSVKETSVGLYANLNEAGTLYWVIVPQGTEYPKPLAGQSGKVDLTSDTAKLQVAAGMNALKSGKASMTAGKDVTFTVSGLSKETAYDLYYVAQDKAGNYSASVKMITIHTLDPNAPTVTQEFTRYNADEKDHPLADTDIRLVFSEAVQDAETNTTLVSLYEAVTTASTDAEKNDARNRMANILRNEIVLYADTGSGLPQEVEVATGFVDKNTADWVIDYRYAEIKLEQGKTVVTFPTKDVKKESALNLKSGATYYFEVQGIADTSESKNVMGVTKLDPFTTVFAQVNLSPGSNTETEIDTGSVDDKPELDLYWRMDPVSTDKVEDGIRWDMIIWSDTTVEFDLYERTGGSGTWTKVNADDKPFTITIDSTTKRSGASVQVNDKDNTKPNSPIFQPLKEIKEGTVYEYAVHFIKVNGEGDRTTWNGTVQMDVNAIAGSNDNLGRMGVGGWEESWNNLVGKDLTNIGVPSTLTLYKPFRDQTAPHFINDRPTFTPGDSVVRMDLMLDRVGTIYWMVAKRGNVRTTGMNGEDYSPSGTNPGQYMDLPESGVGKYTLSIATPSYDQVVDPGKYMVSSDVEYGSLTCGASVQSVTVENLIPNQDYVAYFVIKGTSQVYSSVYCYRFTTGDVTKPYITMQELSPNVAFTTSEDSDLNYVLFAGTELPTVFNQKFKQYVDSSKLAEFSTAAGEEADTMTVLDAIMRTGTGGYSWFDLYAEPPAKEGEGKKIRDTIEQIVLRGQGSGGSPGATGNAVTKAGDEIQRDFTKDMDPQSATNYYCIAVAKNVLGGEYAFKAVSNVHIPDKTPPVLYAPGANGVKKSDGTFSGTLTLNFSENLYWIPENGDTKQICAMLNKNKTATETDAVLEDDGTVTPGKKVLIKHMGGDVDTLTPSSTSAISSTFTFSYSGVRIGDTLTLFSDGYIADARGNSTKTKIILEYQANSTGLNGAIAGGWVIISQ